MSLVETISLHKTKIDKRPFKLLIEQVKMYVFMSCDGSRLACIINTTLIPGLCRPGGVGTDLLLNTEYIEYFVLVFS